MGDDTLNLAELAMLLHRDQRELSKLATRGQLPGRKVGGDWRFVRVEIQHWLETEMRGFNETQLKSLESTPTDLIEPLFTNLLFPDCLEVPLQARTPASVIRSLVRLAEQSWQVYDSESILKAVQAREELASTAQRNGVAILHPAHPMPKALGECVVSFGRTASGIPFGGPGHTMTDLFFLICARDNRAHLRLLTRLTRLFLRPAFFDQLRAAETASESLEIMRQHEIDLLAGK